MPEKILSERAEEAINGTLNYLEFYDVDSAADLRDLHETRMPIGENNGYIKIDRVRVGSSTLSTTRLGYYYNGNKDPILAVWIEKPYFLLTDNGKILFEGFLNSYHIHDFKLTLEGILGERTLQHI